MKKSAINFIIFFIALLMVEQLTAGDIKARAREHFDFHNIISKGNSKTVYRGLSNTINVWWEKPRIYSIGLAFNPVFGSARTSNDHDEQFGKKIKLITLGIEGKYYHRDITPGLFSRLGAGYTRLNTDSPADNIEGYHAYIGAGWEFDINGIGIALEMAFRQSRLEQGIIVNSVTPSVGVHFYR